MRKYEDLKNSKKLIIGNAKRDISNLHTISNESFRVADVAKNSNKIISNLDDQFREATKLDGRDITFLFFATALQCARQYLLTGFKERMSDQEAARKSNGGSPKESSDRSYSRYRPSLEEIISNPVPYDAIFGSPDFDLGLSGRSHRFKTLGHDPLLGWIFGTSNILTSTLTTWNFDSYHIKTGQTARGDFRDKIVNRADTLKVFKYTGDRLFYDGNEGKLAVGTSLLKQWAHLKSDEYSTAGLPIPIVSTISPGLAQKLAEYGVDTGNLKTIGKQATIAALINTLIAMIHGMFYDESKYRSWNLYEVKTRKILSYSNIIASSSNIIYVALTKDAKKFDIGGFLVTLYRIVKDRKFIKSVKQEFLEEEFYNIVIGDEYDF